ncbi:hypothetical protein LTR53_015590 [Teratosphaeriaceae sp. CCFEE 6253]|nr:hypothetical protein LTR53_015590 [Teratosphaeriaceae sp. CCFEE 6253]
MAESTSDSDMTLRPHLLQPVDRSGYRRLAPLRPCFRWPKISNEREIRLLIIKAEANGEARTPGQAYRYADPLGGEPLVCRLTSVNRDQRPEYVAISYTWGNTAQPSAEVCCNDQAMAVTRNCHTVLKTLRRLGLRGPFWIDALCINQAQTEERNAQVALMGETFRQAQSTIVFLCEQEYDGVRAPVVALPELICTPGKQADLEEVSETDLFDFYQQDQRDTGTPAGRTTLKPEIFYYSPWFTRTWSRRSCVRDNSSQRVVTESELIITWTVVQEVMLSQRLCITTEHCETLVPWPVLSRAYERWRDKYLLSDVPDIVLMRNLQDRSPHPGAAKSTIQNGAGFVSYMRSEALRDMEVISKSSNGASLANGTTLAQRLFDILEVTRHFICSDPRDKLFAVLPIAVQAGTTAPKPDYIKSAYEIYRDLTLFFLKQNVPDILSLASLHQGYERHSWLVDWADRSPQAFRLVRYKESALWSAGNWPACQRIHMKASPKRDVLHLRGRPVGLVNMLDSVVLSDGSTSRPRTRQYPARPGDVACVFLGFKLPFLLRRTDVGLQLVDECVIDGMMYGQALTGIDAAEAYEIEPCSGLEDFAIH